MNTASGAKMTKVSHDEILQSIVSFKRPIVPLGLNAKRVIGKRYSLKDAKATSLEEWSDIVARVVAHVSVAETDADKRDEFFHTMSDIMLAREFVPNTPCLVGKGMSVAVAGAHATPADLKHTLKLFSACGISFSPRYSVVFRPEFRTQLLRASVPRNQPASHHNAHDYGPCKKRNDNNDCCRTHNKSSS